MPQYPASNLNNPNQNDVHQVPAHYDQLVQQSQHTGYATGFHHHNTGLMGKFAALLHMLELLSKIPGQSTKQFLTFSFSVSLFRVAEQECHKTMRATLNTMAN